MAQGGRLICLTGETGLGKSRLGSEAAAAARSAGWTVVTVPGGDGRPLGGVQRLLQALASEPLLAPALRAALAELSDEDRARMEPWLTAPGLTATARTEGMGEVTDAELLADLTAGLLQAMARDRRLWIWIDDLQRWDAASLRLIRAVGAAALSGSVARRAAAPDRLAVAASLMSRIHASNGRRRLALYWVRRSAAVPGLSTRVRLMLGNHLAANVPDPHVALTLARKNLEESCRWGVAEAVHQAFRNLLPALAHLGRWPEAKSVFAEWRRLAWRCGVARNVLVVYANWGLLGICHGLVGTDAPEENVWIANLLQAVVYLARGELDACVDLARQALASELPRSYWMVDLYLAAAEASVAQGDAAGAAAWVEQASVGERQTGMWNRDGALAWLQGRIAEVGGQYGQALAAYARACAVTTWPWDAIRARLGAARVCWRLACADPMAADGTALRAQRRAARRRIRRQLERAQDLGYPALVREAQALLQELAPRDPGFTPHP